MTMKINANRVYVSKSKVAHGYGVFASREIPRGDIVEECPAIVLPIVELPLIRKTKLHYYFFEYTAKEFMVALGYGSLYNHSYTPNAQYRFDYRNKILRIRALTSIKKDEEIFFNYNYYSDDRTPLEDWYKVGVDS